MNALKFIISLFSFQGVLYLISMTKCPHLVKRIGLCPSEVEESKKKKMHTPKSKIVNRTLDK